MASNAEKIANLFNSPSTQTEISPTFTLGKKAKKLVAQGAAQAQMGRLIAQQKREKAAAAAEKAAAKATANAARKEAIRAEVKTYSYLSLPDGRVYTFPKTQIHPRFFAANCERMGLNPEDFKLVAVKPRKSSPIETADFRAAFWSATRSFVTTRKNIIWFGVKTAGEAISAIHPTSIGIWFE